MGMLVTIDEDRTYRHFKLTGRKLNLFSIPAVAVKMFSIFLTIPFYHNCRFARFAGYG